MPRTIAAWIGVLALGCYDEGSGLSPDLATVDLGVYTVAEGSDEGITARVSLLAPEASTGSIRLVEGDRLVFRHGGAEVWPSRVDGAFEARLPPGLASWDLVFERPDDESATVTITMPPLSRPTAPEAFSRAEGLTLRWTASDDARFPVTLTLEGACIPTVTRTLAPDPGGYTFQAADLGRHPEDCSVELVLSRRRDTTDTSTALRFAQSSVSTVERLRIQSTP